MPGLRRLKLLLLLCGLHAGPVFSAADQDMALPCDAVSAGRIGAGCLNGNAGTPSPPVDENAPEHDSSGGGEGRSYLMSSWDLDGMDDLIEGDSLSPLRPHRASYLIARKTSNPNLMPRSPAPGHTLATPFDHDATELKFQVSQKAKILRSRNIHFLAFRSFRLWGAYTQQSSWQAFNRRNSSPFRETNHEPELIATLGTGKRHGLKLVNLGWVHQSNGKDLAVSRSWNRVYLQGGWESGVWSALLRGWWRVPEDRLNDDNPDILDYVGRAEISLRWAPTGGNEVVDLVLRNNLRSNPNRGFIQIDWATPVPLSKSTRLHVQLTSGFGESLIDYNHRQTTFGFGFSFRDW